MGKRLLLLLQIIKVALTFWDTGTTTLGIIRTDTVPRQSFFRWQRTEFNYLEAWITYWDWDDIRKRRWLNCVAGISIDFLPITTAALLNHRTLLTSANPLDPYLHRQRDLRIWALGRTGTHLTPYRYRVWRARRIILKSNNPEHEHGPRGRHVPRHDVSIIHSWDQIYIYTSFPTRYHYAYTTTLVSKHEVLTEELHFAGCGYEYMLHVKENYKIFYSDHSKSEIVDCSKYLPKWWGKFICMENNKHYPCIPNGGPLFSTRRLVGVGCFEIRYNERRIMAFTDLRYYIDVIHLVANITPGAYYEYAYPQWGVKWGFSGLWYDGHGNNPVIPHHQVKGGLLPLGK